MSSHNSHIPSNAFIRSWGISLILLLAIFSVLISAIYPYFSVIVSVLFFTMIIIFFMFRKMGQTGNLSLWFRIKNKFFNSDSVYIHPISSSVTEDRATEDTENAATQRETSRAKEEPGRLVDDTQASIIFNRTADAIIELVHQTLNAYSAFFYLYNSGERELVLQSFRSQSVNFVSLDHDLVKLDAAGGTIRFFQRIIERQEPLYINMADQKEALPYYTKPEPVQSVLLMPLLRRGSLLGILGVDHTEMGAFGDHHIQLMHKYVGLIRHSIHTIDAVFVKNRLLRISNALKEYGGIIGNEQSLDKIYQSLKLIIQSVMNFDRYGLWIYKNRSRPMELFDRSGDFPFETGAAGDLPERIVKQVCDTQRPVFIPDIRNYKPESGDVEIKASRYLDTVACVPISDQGHCFGVLVLEAEDKYAFDQHQVQFLESICQMAALATARVYLDAQLASEISYDPLTGIGNQKTFISKISDEIYRAKRFHTTFAVILLRIAGWSKIVNQYGSRESRPVMESVACMLRQTLRQIDAAARLDPDMFGIILIESNYTKASEIAARLIRQIEEKPFEINQLLINIKVHAGIASYGVHGDTVESLMAVADEMVRQNN